MALELPTLAAFKAVPTRQKVALLVLLLGGLGVGFWFYVESPQQEVLTQLHSDVEVLDQEITKNKVKVEKLDELKRLYTELKNQLAESQEALPPAAEAAMLLKQLSNLGTRIGLDFKLWKQGPRVEDSSKLFVRMPVDVEMSGEYHTLALFFDRISKLPRIINVSQIKMGNAKMERRRLSIHTSFQLTAFASTVGSGVVSSASSGSGGAAPPVLSTTLGFTTGSYEYDPKGRRDPFQSLLHLVKLAQPGLELPSLQRFELSDLRLLGIVWGGSGYYGLIQTPDGKGYTVKPGTRVGTNHGVITSITDRRLVVSEPAIDMTGKRTTREVELLLRSTEGRP